MLLYRLIDMTAKWTARVIEIYLCTAFDTHLLRQYINVIVNNNVSNAMAASSSSSAMASSSMSSGGDEAVGKAIGGAVVAFGSAIAVMMVMVFSFLGAAFMIFPIITMHVAIKKLAKATCRQDMLAISIVAIFALQPVAAIMFLAIPDEAYAAQ